MEIEIIQNFIVFSTFFHYKPPFLANHPVSNDLPVFCAGDGTQEGHRQKRLVQMEATELCDPRSLAEGDSQMSTKPRKMVT